MELIYLWIKKHKHIEEKGFNFSPHIQCSYEKNQTLIIKENEYKSIFPENIKISAIIGENGSGKSTLIELISLFRTEIKNFPHFILCYLHKNILYVITRSDYHNFECLDISKIKNETKYKIFSGKSVFSGNMFNISMFTNGLPDFTYQNKYTELLRTSRKYDQFYNGFNVNYTNPNEDKKIFEQNLKYAHILKFDESIFKNIDMKFMFDMYKIEIDFNNYGYSIDKKYQQLINDRSLNNTSFDIEGLDSIFSKYENIKTGQLKVEYLKKYKKNIFHQYIAIQCIDQVIYTFKNISRDFKEELAEKYIIKLIDDINIYTKMADEQIKDRLDSLDKSLLKYFTVIAICHSHYKNFESSFLLPYLQSLKKTKRKGAINEIKREYYYLFKGKSFFKHFDLLWKIFDNNFELEDFALDKYVFVSKATKITSKDINKYHNKIFKYKFFEELYWTSLLRINFINSQHSQYTYNSLSTGEKQLFNLLINFAYTIISTSDENLTNHIYFFEEVDVGLHPEWQKKIIYNVLSLLEFLYRKHQKIFDIHLLFTTHSPFMLSDIPKEHVVFIKNGKQIQSFKDNEQTFGANIHNLLAHGFFMEKGLLGEFARKKIQQVIYHLNQKEDELEKKDILPIIDKIGEPFLKQKLIEQYYDRYPEEKNIDNEIELLEKKLVELKNVKNSN